MLTKYRFCVQWQPTFLPDLQTISWALCSLILSPAPWEPELTDVGKTVNSQYCKCTPSSLPPAVVRAAASPGSQHLPKKHSSPETPSDSCGDPGLIKAPGQSEQSSGVSLVPTGGNTRSSISDVFLEWSSPSTSLFPPKFRPLLPLVQTIVLVWSTNALTFSLFKV